MPSYFRQVPDFEYVSRDSEQRQISEYATVKNLFRRGKLREDIFGDLAFFTKYKIIGDERPDNVAYKIYNDETLDWVILLSNNILNIQTEWPLPQKVFDNVMLEKYETYDNLYNGIHHYETQEIKDSVGNLILPSGIKIPSEWKSGNGFLATYKTQKVLSITYSPTESLYNVSLDKDDNLFDEDGELISIKNQRVFLNGFEDSTIDGEHYINDIQYNNETSKIIIIITANEEPTQQIPNATGYVELVQNNLKSYNQYYYEYYDTNLNIIVTIPASSILTPITNYEYESQLEDDKRNIFVLKPRYLNIVFNDMEEIMKYKKGSSQYVSRTLKKGDNIRLYK